MFWLRRFVDNRDLGKQAGKPRDPKRHPEERPLGRVSEDGRVHCPESSFEARKGSYRAQMRSSGDDHPQKRPAFLAHCGPSP
jgi:hypothetical protein